MNDRGIDVKAMLREKNKSGHDALADITRTINYVDALIYDMVNIAMQWTELQSENECREFIIDSVRTLDVSIGDFTKAMLKIVTITKELMNVCEIIGEMELMYKLSKIEGLVLKYVTTSQSLYV
jgi:hypothetical protein